MELRKRALGVAFGLLWGLSILIGTWWLLLFGSHGAILEMLSKFFIGYSYSWGGSVFGFLWGFILGFVCGFFVAWIYNIANKFFSKPKAA
jgi:hypothetical protein